MRMGLTEWAMLIALSILWGGSFFFGEVALSSLPPLTVALCRVGLAAATLLCVGVLLGRRLPPPGRVWGAFLVMGALNNAVPFTLILWGQTHIAGGLAAILNATTPLFTVVLAHVLTRDEPLTALKGTGVLFGIGGVAVMIGTDVLHGLGDNVTAQVAVLGGALSYAFAGIYGRRFRDQPALVTATGQLCASTVLLAPLALAFEQPWTLALPGAAVLASIAGLALLSTALGYILYFRILQRSGATNLMLVTFLIPPTAIVLGALVLHEVLEPRHFAGLAFVAVGLACIDGRLVSRARRPRKADVHRPANP